MIYSACASRVIPGCSQRLVRFSKLNAGFGASSLGIDQELPTTLRNYDKGKSGVHSEYLGFILAELQYMQRAYPNMEW